MSANTHQQQRQQEAVWQARREIVRQALEAAIAQTQEEIYQLEAALAAKRELERLQHALSAPRETERGQDGDA